LHTLDGTIPSLKNIKSNIKSAISNDLMSLMIGARYGGGGCYATWDLKMSSTCFVGDKSSSNLTYTTIISTQLFTSSSFSSLSKNASLSISFYTPICQLDPLGYGRDALSFTSPSAAAGGMAGTSRNDGLLFSFPAEHRSTPGSVLYVPGSTLYFVCDPPEQR